MGLQRGKTAPDFELKDQDGEKFHLESELKKGPVVLFFYPADFTPGCTAEACSFRDSYEQFTDAGAIVAGISTDSANSHRRFASKYRLPFTLLSDTGGVVARKFAVGRRLMGLLPGRETFVIDRSGKVRLNFNSMGPKGHVKTALEIVRELKGD